VRVRPGQYAYLQLPGLSPAEWHPLSAVCHVGAPDTVAFLVLNGGRNALGARIRDLAAASPLDRTLWARLDGPYGGPSLQMRYYSTVLLVAGGVGIAPFVTLSRALLDPRPGSERQLRQATLLWSIRNERAARAFVPGLLEELRASGVFRVRVHLTHEGQHMGDDKHHAEPMRAQLLRAIAAQAAAAESAEDGPELGDEAAPPGSNEAAYQADDAVCAEGGSDDGDAEFVNGRADVSAAVREVVAAAAAAGEPACRVAVLVCGPPPMVDAVQDAAAAAGCHFHAEKFIT
jgi:NAD(P)H-flavin reductase